MSGCNCRPENGHHVGCEYTSCESLELANIRENRRKENGLPSTSILNPVRSSNAMNAAIVASGVITKTFRKGDKFCWRSSKRRNVGVSLLAFAENSLTLDLG